MNAIRNVFTAFTNLAAALNGLAGVIDSASAKLRMQLAGESDPPALTHGGEVIDAEASPSADSNGTPAAKARNGRKAATA